METNYAQVEVGYMALTLTRLRANHAQLRQLLHEGVTHVTLHTPFQSATVPMIGADANPLYELIEQANQQIERLEAALAAEQERANRERMDLEEMQLNPRRTAA